jgi:hypothetical protein
MLDSCPGNRPDWGFSRFSPVTPENVGIVTIKFVKTDSFHIIPN